MASDRPAATEASEATNLEVSKRLLDEIAHGKIAPDLVTPDFKVWTASGGDQTGAQYAQSVAQLARVLNGPLEFKTIGTTVQGARVAIEARSLGHLKTGRDYENAYHLLFIIRDGRVAELHAYFNTAVARDVLHPLFEALQKQ